MPPQGRGGVPPGFLSKSTPNLPTLRAFNNQPAPGQPSAPLPEYTRPTSPRESSTSPSEPASVEDNLQDDAGDSGRFGADASSGSESEDGIDEKPPAARPLYTSRSQSHLPPHTSALFPPFYNRPPTPLPPSPSLTSLLRPSFSTQTSRPTTPDSSDVEVPSGVNGASTPTSTTTNLASITKSARHAPTVPRASPKVPTYEYYGFALYLTSSAAFLMYIIWAYVPSPLLHQMGIHYYPNRWWAIAVPAWMVVTVLYIYVALASYNTRYLTLPLSSCENLVDECGQVAIVDKRTRKLAREQPRKAREKDHGGKSTPRRNVLADSQFSASDEVDWKKLWSVGTDAVMDVPIGGVCEILYGQGRTA